MERSIEVSENYEEERKYYEGNQEVQEPEFTPYFRSCGFLNHGISHYSNVHEQPVNVNFMDDEVNGM